MTGDGFFLTDIDSRAAVKGSRDPLGLVPLWGRFGRHVVGNLTTVSGSVRGFVTLLLGYHFAARVRAERGAEAESTLHLFLKLEQLAAYSRVRYNDDRDIRGIERTKRFLSGKDPIRLSPRPENLILSDQKTYGLWGLFSAPARASGLLERREEILTPAARRFVEEQYLARLSRAGFRDGNALVALLAQKRPQIHIEGQQHGKLAQAIASLHREITPAARQLFREHLLHGGPNDPTQGLQALLAELMWAVDQTADFDRDQLRKLVSAAAKRGENGARLAHFLDRIDRLESLLVPAASAFSLLLARHGRGLSSVASEVGSAWKGPLETVDAAGIADLRDEIAAAFGEQAAGDRWVEMADALAGGHWERLLHLLVEHNGFVMRSRHGSQAWVRVENGKIDVRFRDESGGLADRSRLRDAWVNNYFLNPLKAVRAQLEGEPR